MSSISYISLGNLIIDKQAFRELLQNECTGSTITQEVQRLLFDTEYRGEMLKCYTEIREALGGEGASVKIANAMIEELNKNK